MLVHARKELVGYFNLAGHGVGQFQHQLFLCIEQSFGDDGLFDRIHLPLAHSGLHSNGGVGIELVHGVVQNRHTQNHQLANIGGQAVALANSSGEFFPSCSQRGAVEQVGVERCDLAAFGHNFGLNVCQSGVLANGDGVQSLGGCAHRVLLMFKP